MSDKTYATEQEAFWAGDFGVDYIQRNKGEFLLASNLDFFCKALHQAHGIGSCIEFGANIGMNLRALKLLFPGIDAHAVEINAVAAKELGSVVHPSQLHNCSILDFTPSRKWDLALIKGVLIHMNPDALPQVYKKLAASAGRYLLVAEYYNPSPVAIPYRGHKNRLFKRDFAGEIISHHPEFQLIDYGFVYHADPKFPQDDISWFLMEKR